MDCTTRCHGVGRRSRSFYLFGRDSVHAVICPKNWENWSELRSLILGSHNDAINSLSINKIDDPDELIAAQRADFKQMTLDCSLAEMAPRNVECPA